MITDGIDKKDPVETMLESARESLLSYCAFLYEPFQAPWHIVKIAQALRAIESGKIKRLIITVPPRHGKSMLCSQFFPSWFLGRNPHKYIISTSYGQDLATDWGGKVKNQMQDPLFHKLFPDCLLKFDTQSKTRLETSKGGQYFAVGAGGVITGRGAHLLLIDDPIRNREDAESPAMQIKLVDWYRSVARTRLMKDGAICVVQARWNSSDLVGWIEQFSAHEGWLKIDLPAVKDGKPLWPEMFTMSALNDIKLTMGEYDWASLYMQKPIDSSAHPIRADWIVPYKLQTKILTKVTYVDPAISQDRTADETAIVTVGLEDITGKIVDLEVVHGRWTYEEIKKNCMAVYERQRPNFFVVESVQAQDWLVQDLNNDGIPAIGDKPDTDKIRKANAITHFFESGRVGINDKFLQEQLKYFPVKNSGGEIHDDVADAFISALTMFKKYSADKMPEIESQWRKIRKRTWKETVNDDSVDINKIFNQLTS